MPAIEPYRDQDMPERFMRWIETLREILRPAPKFMEGTGSPEGVHKAERGTRFLRTDGVAGTRLYFKATQTKDATGWVAYDEDGAAGGGSAAVRIISTADENFSSTTLTNHSELSGWALTAGKQYRIHGRVHMRGQFSSGQFKLHIGFSNLPVGGQYFHKTVSWGSTAADGLRDAIVQQGNSQHVHANVKNFEECFVDVDAIIRANTTTGGTFNFQVAQNVTSANVVTVFQGSWIEVELLD